MVAGDVDRELRVGLVVTHIPDADIVKPWSAAPGIRDPLRTRQKPQLSHVGVRLLVVVARILIKLDGNPRKR